MPIPIATTPSPSAILLIWTASGEPPASTSTLSPTVGGAHPRVSPATGRTVTLMVSDALIELEAL